EEGGKVDGRKQERSQRQRKHPDHSERAQARRVTREKRAREHEPRGPVPCVHVDVFYACAAERRVRRCRGDRLPAQEVNALQVLE
ncbi:hypothetical protein BJV78DRAFT_1198192, partial [Lactifluus subvellereus]